jgi:5'-3' exonuclease
LSKQKLLKTEEDVRKSANTDVLFKKQTQPVCSSLNLDRSKCRKEEEKVMSSKENKGACGFSEPSVSNSGVGNNEESITLDIPDAIPTVKEDSATISDDPTTWLISEYEFLIDLIAKRGYVKQNVDSDFTNSCRQYSDFPRYLNKGLFYRTMRNVKNQLRQFLVYSESRGSVFCIPCLLFNGTSQFSKRSEGFNDWKNGQSRLTAH